MDLLSTNYFSLFLIICIGFILGNIKFKGISLDVSAVIFVALFFGHIGVSLPPIILQIGLILFIYTIGIQAGPGFFEAFSKNGKNLILISLLVIVSGALVTYLGIEILGISKSLGIGVLTGALTSTPGLAVAIEATQSSEASIGYSIAYPFGVVGVILFVRLLPKLIKLDIKKEEQAYDAESTIEVKEQFAKHFIVENEKVIGKTLSELKVRFMTGAVVSRIQHQEQATTPTRQTKLHKGDLIRAVGTPEALNRIQILIGSETKKKIELNKGYCISSILVTNKEVVGKSIRQLNLFAGYNATVVRIRRSGIELPSAPTTKFQMGDKVLIASDEGNSKLITKLFGNDSKKLSDTDFMPIAIGIVLGILVGRLSINFSDSFSFSFGLTGGVLLVGLLLSKLGKTGPIVWTMTGAANQLLRQFGLLLFLAAVGTNAGAKLVSTFHAYGVELFIFGAIVNIVPMVVATLAAKYFLKLNFLSFLGSLTGSMTSTPGLAAVTPLTAKDAPLVAYATVYPIAMVVLIIMVQILSMV